jgi:parallel beta-helix repeat protein
MPFFSAKKYLRAIFLVFLLSLDTVFISVPYPVFSTQSQSSPRTWIVSQHHPLASDQSPGNLALPLKTISRAAELAMPGDTILVRTGVYRERVAPLRSGQPERPITYRAASDETVIVKGSEIWSPNPKPLAGNRYVYSGSMNLVFGDFNPFTILLKRMHTPQTLGQVFVDGEPSVEVGSIERVLEQSNSWFFNSEDRRLYLHFSHDPKPPLSRLVEVSVRGRIFAPHKRGLGYIHVKGFTFEHAANQFPSNFWNSRDSPQAGAISTRSGHHWVIEDNIIRYAKAIGLDCGSEGKYDLEGNQPTPEGVGYHYIHNNTIIDNGCCGLVGWKQTGTKIIGNRIERNNLLGWTAPEIGGIKVHKFVGGLIEGNLIRDNDAFGIWLDNVYRDSRVTRNVAINNAGAGIFVEMGDGPILVDNNVVAFTREGEGIYTHDASGVTVAHNLLYGNTHFGVYMRTVTERQFGNASGKDETVATSHQRIYNNIFVDNYRGQVSLPFSSKRDFDNHSDYNLLIGGTKWNWEGLGLNRFVLNTSDGRVKQQRIVDAFRTSIEEQNVPKIQRPNFNLWTQQPYLNLDEWRFLSGNEHHSFAPTPNLGNIENGALEKGSMNLSARSLFVEFDSDTPFQILHALPLQEVERDYFGNPIPPVRALAGPFQGWQRGYNRFDLWPIPLFDSNKI